MKKLFVHTTATALLLSQLGLANTALAAENGTSPTTDQIQKEEAPMLVKGDFFYFVKTTIEKIQLLLTTDKVKEAELLAEFAGERIHEARELIKEGKEDLAKESLKQALTQMEVAQGQVDVKLPTDMTNTTTTGNTTNTTTVGTTSTTGDTANTTTEGTTTTGNTTTTPAQDTDKEEVEKEDADKEEKHKLTKEQKEIAKIQHHLNNNLLVLANVLDQVKNPKAKAAIAKNIEKSFNKISEKLEKLLKKSEHKETVLKPVITINYPDATNTTEKPATPEVITTITKIEDVENTETNNVNSNKNDGDDKDDDSKEATEVATKPVQRVDHKKEHHKFEQKHKEEKEHKEKHEEKRGNGKNHKQHDKNEKHEWKNNRQSDDNESNKHELHNKKSDDHKSNGHNSPGHESNDRNDNERGNKKDK